MKLKDLLEQKKKKQERLRKKENAKKIAAGTATGILAGIAGGLLLAPKSGKETRQDISKAAKDINDTVKNKTIEAKKSVGDKAKDTKENFVEAKQKISDYLTQKKNSRKNCEDSVECIEEVPCEACKNDECEDSIEDN